MIRNRLRRLEALLRRAEAAVRSPLRPAARPLGTAQDVVALLHEQVEALRADPSCSPLERARAIAYLAMVARKAIETGQLAGRLEMLERVLRQRATSEGTG